MSHNLRVEKEESKRAKEVSSQTNNLYEQELAALKKDLEQVQNSYLKEREHFLLEKDDLKQEVLILRKTVDGNGRLMDENNILCKEVRNLKELLMESSGEMQRCKDEFVRLASEK